MSAPSARLAVIALLLLTASPVLSADQTLTDKMHHLRWGDARDWDSFPETAEAATLRIPFQSTANKAERTLRIRHRDLRQAWEVRLNGKKVATLPRDDPETITCWPMPAGVLKDGDNLLEVVCVAKTPAVATPSAQASDDVMIGDIALLDAPRSTSLSQATVLVNVVDETSGTAIPCRITVADDKGALVDIGNTSTPQLAVRPGVVYTADGRADLQLAAGQYTLYAGRGFEYNLASATLDVKAGDKLSQSLKIRRVVPTASWVACDPHVHTFTYSRHGDATIAERMLTLAGEGIELPIATDHNLNIDYEQHARDAGVRQWFTPVCGNEVTTKIGHFNVFPLAGGGKLPDWRAPTWEKMAASIDATKTGDAVVILNHGCDIHLGFRPFDPIRHLTLTGENLDGWDLPVNAMEVINSGATLSDPMMLFENWFGLMNRGKRIAPMGTSDSHDVSRFIVGQGRTYIRAPDGDPAKIDAGGAIAAIRDGKVLVSYGLIADLTVNDRFGPGDTVTSEADGVEQLKVTVRVLGPEWTQATTVTLYANGVPVRTAEVPPDQRSAAGLKFETTWSLPTPTHDVWLTAIASGPGVTGPWWPMSKPYQKTTTAWTGYVMGASGAVWIDADRSGSVDSAYHYASGIARQADGDADRAVASLRAMEPAGKERAADLQSAAVQSIAAQVAGLLRQGSPEGFDAAMVKALKADVGPAARQGLEQFLATWKNSAAARTGSVVSDPAASTPAPKR